MSIVIYGNGSSGNHGCEAITRGTVKLFGKEKEYIVQSAGIEDDTKYGLVNLVELWNATNDVPKNFRFILAYLRMKLLGEYLDIDGLCYVPGIERASSKCKLAISVGGDNYCYSGTEIYGWLNNEYRKQGFKTALWGCSVEPNLLENKEVAEDLASYNLIVARESITYDAIKKVQKNTILAPDPAFFMDCDECKTDPRILSDKVIGINISPHIIKCETSDGMAYENYKCLIKYILDNTDYSIALIPHVVWETNDDRTVLQRLYEDFDCDPRLIMVEDHNAPELKYIISKCCLFVGARTHATIAAYSSAVPTLVVGYSVKARGIARDLFGTEENYVLPVQDLDKPEQLTDAFKWLEENENSIRTHLKEFLPEYLKSAKKAVDAIKELE